MKKKKLIIPFAVLAISLGVGGLAVGCGGNNHEHVDADRNGKCDVCDTDMEIPPIAGTLSIAPTSNGSVVADKLTYNIGDTITFTITPKTDYKLKRIMINQTDLTASVSNGKLAYTTTEADTAITVYVTFEAVDTEQVISVKGHKYGEIVSFAGQKLKLTSGNGVAVAEADVSADGKATFTAVKKGTYNAVVDGYTPKEVTIGGTELDVTLEYTAFTAWKWQNAHDYSAVNDADDTYIGVIDQTDLNCISVDKHDDVSVSFWAKSDNSSHGDRTQGLFLKFADGKYAGVAASNSGLQWLINTGWGKDVEWVTGLTVPNNDGNQVAVADGNRIASFSQAQLQKFQSEEGLQVQIVRSGNTLKVFVDGTLFVEKEIGDTYAESEVQVGFWGWNGTMNARWQYEIADVTEANVSLPATVEHGTVTADKTSYAFGETATLTVTPAENYQIKSFKVNGKEATVVNNKYSFVVTRANNRVEVEFEQKDFVTLTLNISGKKLGATTNFNGETITLTGPATYNLTVTDGVASNDKIGKGIYTVLVDGYLPQTVEITESGAKTLVFEYDMFDNVYKTEWTKDVTVDFENSAIVMPDGGDVKAFTKETYDDVIATLTAKGSYNSNKSQGIWLKFGSDEKVAGIGIYQSKLFWWNGVWGDVPYAEDAGNVVQIQSVADGFEGNNGVKIQLARRGINLYVYIEDELAATWKVNEKYAEDTVKVGFFVEAPGTNSVFPIGISADLSVGVNIAMGIEHGSVTPDKTSYKIGDTVELTLAPSEELYVLKSLTVGGVDVTREVKGGKYSFTVYEDTAVTAEFGVREEAALTLNLTGNKFGETVDLSGSKVTLTNNNLYDSPVELDIANGVATTAKLYKGDYVLSVEGYLPIEVTFDGTALTKVLNYIVFDNVYKTEWTKDVTVDYEKSAIVMPNGGDVKVYTKDTYDTVIATLTAKGSNNSNKSQGIWLKFGSDEKVAGIGIYQSELFWWNGVWSEVPYAEGAGNVVKIQSVKSDFEGENGAKIQLARKGNHLFVYINDVFAADWTVNEKYASDTVKVGYFAEAPVNNSVFPFAISKTLPDAAVTLPETVAGATVATDKQSYKLGDTVKLTVTVTEGCELTKFKVGGQDVIAELQEGTAGALVYSFVAMSLNTSVEVETLQAVTRTNVKFTVDSAWNANGLTFKLSKEGETDITSGAIANNEATVASIKSGVWTLSTELFGMPYSQEIVVPVTGDVAIDLGACFQNGVINKANVNLADGTMTYKTKDKADMRVKTSVTGDAWFTSTWTIEKSEWDKIMFSGQANFGVGVKFVNGESRYYWFNVSSQLYQGNPDWTFQLKATGNLAEGGERNDERLLGSITGVSTETETKYTLSKYGNALVKDSAVTGSGTGLRMTLRYDSANGKIYIYFGTSDNDLTLFEGFAVDAPKNGNIVAFGAHPGGDKWGDAAADFTVSGFGYGATLADALGLQSGALTVTNTATDATDHGHVTVEGGIGAATKLTAIPANGYSLTSLKVNGVEMIGKVKENVLDLGVWGSGAITIVPEFTEMVSLNATVNVKKEGETVHLDQGTKVKFVGIDTYEFTVDANGKIGGTTGKIGLGTYKVEIEGNSFEVYDKTIQVTENVTAVNLDYALLTWALGWNNGHEDGRHDLSHVNDAEGYIAMNWTESMQLVTTDTFTDARGVLQAVEGNSDGMQGIWFKFGNQWQGIGFYNQELYWWTGPWGDQTPVVDGGNALDKLVSKNETSSRFNVNIKDYPTASGVKLTFTRSGNVLKVYLGNDLVGTMTIDAKYAEAEVQVGFFCSGCKADAQVKFEIMDSAWVPAASQENE